MNQPLSFRIFVASAVLSVSVSACTGRVETQGSSGGGAASTTTTGTAGGGGSGTTSATTTTTTTPTMTTTTTTTKNPSCVGWLWFYVDVVDADGTSYGCTTGNDLWDFSSAAVVTGMEGDAILIDTCPPGSGCDPHVLKIHPFQLPSPVSIPAGALVQVDIHVASDFVATCSASTQIVNLPSWQGTENPITSRPLTWLHLEEEAFGPAESDGPDVGLTAIPVSDCVENPGPGDVVYDYRFYDWQDEANEQIVHVGDTGTLHVQRDGMPETWTFVNGQAGCLPGNCADSYPYYYYLAQAPGG